MLINFEGCTLTKWIVPFSILGFNQQNYFFLSYICIRTDTIINERIKLLLYLYMKFLDQLKSKMYSDGRKEEYSK